MKKPTRSKAFRRHLDVRRINRRTAYVVLRDMPDEDERTNHHRLGLLYMMRELVREYGVEGALSRVKFPSHIPQEALEIQRLCMEYLAFEEGQPGEAELIEKQQQVQREMKGSSK